MNIEFTESDKVKIYDFLNGWFEYNNPLPENKYLLLSKRYQTACDSARIQGVKRENFKWVNSNKDFRGYVDNINYVILYDFEYPEWYQDFLERAIKYRWQQYHW